MGHLLRFSRPLASAAQSSGLPADWASCISLQGVRGVLRLSGDQVFHFLQVCSAVAASVRPRCFGRGRRLGTSAMLPSLDRGFQYLQGLVTNDLSALETSQKGCVYACLLNAQGRHLHDMFVHRVSGDQPAVLLDVDASGLPDLVKLLRRLVDGCIRWGGDRQWRVLPSWAWSHVRGGDLTTRVCTHMISRHNHVHSQHCTGTGCGRGSTLRM